VRSASLLVRSASLVGAFVNPVITSRFWFTKTSGRLEVGKQVHWEWEMYGIPVPVTATAIESHQRIAIEWPGYGR
jgi:hypothetical protein